jgi:hypothetical protein
MLPRKKWRRQYNTKLLWMRWYGDGNLWLSSMVKVDKEWDVEESSFFVPYSYVSVSFLYRNKYLSKIHS